MDSWTIRFMRGVEWLPNSLRLREHPVPQQGAYVYVPEDRREFRVKKVTYMFDRTQVVVEPVTPNGAGDT